jgi:hypothetical protein
VALWPVDYGRTRGRHGAGTTTSRIHPAANGGEAVTLAARSFRVRPARRPPCFGLVSRRRAQIASRSGIMYACSRSQAWRPSRQSRDCPHLRIFPIDLNHIHLRSSPLRRERKLAEAVKLGRPTLTPTVRPGDIPPVVFTTTSHTLVATSRTRGRRRPPALWVQEVTRWRVRHRGCATMTVRADNPAGGVAMVMLPLVSCGSAMGRTGLAAGNWG